MGFLYFPGITKTMIGDIARQLITEDSSESGFIAFEDIPAETVVVLFYDGGVSKVKIIDPTNVDHGNLMVGFVKDGVSAGETCNVFFTGEVELTTKNFGETNTLIFAGQNGVVLTEEEEARYSVEIIENIPPLPPTLNPIYAFHRCLGKSISPTKVILNILPSSYTSS